jgi:protein-tyrosine phosphatase
MMKSDVVTIQSPDDREAIRRIGRLLREGAIVALPTETVYGLAAKAEKEVIDRLDRLKGRPADKRYTLHIGRCEELTLYVPRPSLQARKLMHHFWPGPLTIVFELDKKSLEHAQNALPDQTYEILYRDGTLGIRCPAHPVTSALLTEALAPIVAPSANPSHQPPAVSAAQAAAYFDGRIDAIIDSPGACTYRKPSTVVRSGSRGLEVLREGVFTQQDILHAGTVNLLFVCTGNTCRSPMAEALCRKYLADKFNCSLDDLPKLGYSIESAGIAAFEGMPASRHALEISRERHAPLDSHRSRQLTDELIARADLIFVMTPMHRQMVIQAAPQAKDKCFLLDPSAEIPDPIGQDSSVYRACAEHIERCLSERMNELL